MESGSASRQPVAPDIMTTLVIVAPAEWLVNRSIARSGAGLAGMGESLAGQVHWSSGRTVPLGLHRYNRLILSALCLSHPGHRVTAKIGERRQGRGLPGSRHQGRPGRGAEGLFQPLHVGI